MLPSHKSSIHLFRCLGVDVYLHYSWFVVAIIEISYSGHIYSSYLWNVYEYLALFGIVLMHEFGHALACRSVGGKADQIVLWPLGGVAYVAPPPRPGATLWSLAAGPLVNLLLAPILFAAWLLVRNLSSETNMPDTYEFVTRLCWINGGLLCFNLLPIYPLDGGQILRSLLWYFLGRTRSLLIASTTGMVAAAVLLVFAIRSRRDWFCVLAAFAIIQCWSGFQQARLMARLEAAPRRDTLACPSCRKAPPTGEFWTCGRCRRRFDMFATHGVCPKCGAAFEGTRCMECGQGHRLVDFGQV